MSAGAVAALQLQGLDGPPVVGCHSVSSQGSLLGPVSGSRSGVPQDASRAVTVIIAAVVGLTFLVGFGNVLSPRSAAGSTCVGGPRSSHLPSTCRSSGFFSRRDTMPCMVRRWRTSSRCAGSPCSSARSRWLLTLPSLSFVLRFAPGAPPVSLARWGPPRCQLWGPSAAGTRLSRLSSWAALPGVTPARLHAAGTTPIAAVPCQATDEAPTKRLTQNVLC